MLLLTRRVGERIFIKNKSTNEIIILTNVQVSGNHCKIGIQAPKEYHIWREELGPDAKHS